MNVKDIRKIAQDAEKARQERAQQRDREERAKEAKLKKHWTGRRVAKYINANWMPDIIRAAQENKFETTVQLDKFDGSEYVSEIGQRLMHKRGFQMQYIGYEPLERNYEGPDHGDYYVYRVWWTKS